MGRGIWIVDDIHAAAPADARSSPRRRRLSCLRAPAQQRIEANGGWVNGAAAFVGDNPARGTVITYYQRTRHLFGKLRIEVLDSSGELIDELPASTPPRA